MKNLVKHIQGEQTLLRVLKKNHTHMSKDSKSDYVGSFAHEYHSQSIAITEMKIEQGIKFLTD